MNPERAILSSRTLNERDLKEYEKIFWNKFIDGASNELRRKKNKIKASMIDMDEATSVYDGKGVRLDMRLSNQDVVNTDKVKVKNMRNRNKEVDKTQRAIIFETIIEDCAEVNDWFGDNSFVTSTTEYDDRFNHADFVVEWENENDRYDDCPKIAIDCTVAENKDVIKEKVRRVIDDIKNGKLTNIKYFISEGKSDSGPLEYIPRVVIAVEKEKLDGLCKTIVEGNASNNQIQVYILEQILEQLNTQYEAIKERKVYINSNNESRSKMMRSVEGVIKEIEKHLKLKKQALGNYNEGDMDFIKSVYSDFLQAA